MMAAATEAFRILVVVAAAAALFAGCSRDGAETTAQPATGEAPSPVAPEVYMKDPAFRAALAERNASRKDLAKSRNAVVSRMVEMIEAKKKELGTDDEAVLKAALEKDPEWNSLYARCEDVNTAIEENRRETIRVVRKRLTEAPPAAAREKVSK